MEEKRKEKEKEEKEKRKKEEELRKKIEEKRKEKEKEKENASPEKNILRAKKSDTHKKEKKQTEKALTDYPLKKSNDLEKSLDIQEEGKIEENDVHKPKKKKKFVKKTITKMVKKKVHRDSEEYQKYLKEKENGFRTIGGPSFGGGIGSSDIMSKSYTAVISKPVSSHSECINCHANISKGNSGKNLCNSCLGKLRENNKNDDKELKNLKYYREDIDEKFDTMNTKEFYQLNKDRYLNDLWKEENDKLAKIDENFTNNKNIEPTKLKNDNNSNKLLFDKLICSKCGQIQNLNSSKGTYFCKNCEGIICGNCSKSHYKDNPQHICNHINIEDKRYWVIPEQIKCSNCNELKPLNDIYNCTICEGKPFCKNCSQKHKINNPKHILKLLGESNEVPENSLKNQNDHNINNPSHSKSKDDYDINKLKKRTLTDDKLFKNKSGEPNQKTDKSIENKKINFTSNCKICNNLLPLREEECILVNCTDCDGNLCDECGDKHEKDFPQHDLNPIRVLFIENIIDINDSIPKIKCGKCKKNISDNEDIYYCDECGIDLCSTCGDNHNNENPDHDLLLTKRILINYNKGDINCRQCGINISKNDNAFRKCDKCKIDLCDACGDKHIEKHPNHNILYTLLRDNYKPNKNNNYNKDNDILLNNKELNKKNDLENQNIDNVQYTKLPHDINCMSCNSKINNFKDCMPCYGYLCPSCNNSKQDNRENKFQIIKPEKTSFDPSRVNCIICNEYLLKDINRPINHCIICKGNLCSKCSTEHLNIKPSHNLQKTKFILTEIILFDEQITHNKNTCLECKKNLDNKNSKFILFCNQCRNNICLDCAEKHNLEYPEHIIILSKNIGNNSIDSKKGDINCTCFLCNSSHYEVQNKKFYLCEECNKTICESCKNKHDKQFYSHIITKSHSYEDDKIKK